ncbi:MAG TPA: hypothetical protein VMU38_08160 [Candidatus Binatia bacterium]|nr:hypothetical protein [Candidatus Binatia bacterium]
MPNQTIDRAGVADAAAEHAFAQSLIRAKVSGETAVSVRRDPGAAVSMNEKNLEKHPLWASLNPALQKYAQNLVTPQPPPQLPSQLGPFNSGYITFDNGVPVGGSMSLTLYQDGGYAFSGSFHDSGFPSYKIEADWVIVSQSGKAFTFSHAGETYGTIDSGSRDFTFSDIGNNGDIKDAWADLCAGYTWRWTAYCNWDVQAAIDDLINALKVAGTVITAVIAVVALF